MECGVASPVLLRYEAVRNLAAQIRRDELEGGEEGFADGDVQGGVAGLRIPEPEAVAAEAPQFLDVLALPLSLFKLAQELRNGLPGPVGGVALPARRPGPAGLELVLDPVDDRRARAGLVVGRRARAALGPGGVGEDLAGVSLVATRVSFWIRRFALMKPLSVITNQ